MCPDHQILSLYIDGELPSPWKEKMEAHLVSCEKCQNRLGQYQRLKAVLEEDRIGVSKELENRVWNKVSSRKTKEEWKFSSNDEKRFSTTRDKNRPDIWKRRVSLPFPAVAAAAAVFIIFAFLAIQGIRSPITVIPQGSGIATGIGADVQGLISVSDMNDVLQYLSREDTADFMIIRLPETRSFSSSGEPALLKAADYSRRTASR